MTEPMEDEKTKRVAAEGSRAQNASANANGEHAEADAAPATGLGTTSPLKRVPRGRVATAIAQANTPQGPESGTFMRTGAAFEGEPLASAKGLELKTLSGYAYKGVDIDVYPGEVVAVRGRNGSGKTALLLTLAARMNPTGGTLRVAGYNLPRQRGRAARTVGMSLFDGINDLQSSLTVAYAVGAEFELYGRRPRRDAVRAFMDECGILDLERVRVKDLTALQRVQVGVALAFVPNPRMIVVDDIEDQLTKAQSTVLMKILIEAARERDVAVVVGVLERDLAAMADACVYLSKEGE